MSDFVEQNSSISNFNYNSSWTILNTIEQNIKNKINNNGIQLKNWRIQINYGIKTGCNKAFIIDSKKKEELIASDPKSAEIIRPILRGKDIKRYNYDFAELWLISTFPSKKYDIDDYPAVKKYLLSFGKEKLEQTGKTYIINGNKIKSRKKTNNKWFETQDSISYWDDFSKQKIAWGNLCLESKFALVEENIFVSAPSPVIVPGSPYLLSILNSKIANWYIRNLGVTRNGGYFEYKPMFVEQLPIPNVSNEVKGKLEKLVSQIHHNIKLGKSTFEFEKEIDRIIYNIYELSDEEIKYVENL